MSRRARSVPLRVSRAVQDARADVSPCGTMAARPEFRRLVLKRFGIVDEVARPDRLYIDIDLPRRYHWKPDRRRPGAFRRPRRLSLRDARTYCPLRMIRAVCSIVGLTPIAICDKRTARGFHVVVVLPWSQRLPMMETIIMQLLCGSDPRRERLNFMRARSIRQFGAPPHFRNRWNLLFSRKLEGSM